MKIIVVGAGIIGALTAFRLAQQGADVTVIEAGQPACAASGASFGWINASFHINEDHFHLRVAAMAAHRRLAAELKTRATCWAGTLCWETEGEALDLQHQTLKALGYDVRMLDRRAISALEPSIVAPERALRFADEGAVSLPLLAAEALAAATALGARIISGVSVLGLQERSGIITGVRWFGGIIPADQVLVTAGVATQSLLASVGVTLPMLSRPCLILRTAPMPPLVSHVLVTPGQELRQDQEGRFLAPTVAGHQSDATDSVSDNPMLVADAAAKRVSKLLGQSATWTDVTLAYRPMPGDGLPVMGRCGPAGLYVSTMHSGATLAPIVAEFAAQEVLEMSLSNTEAALIAPYRPQRFTA